MCENCCYFDGQRCEFGENNYSLFPGECKQFDSVYTEDYKEDEGNV